MFIPFGWLSRQAGNSLTEFYHPQLTGELLPRNFWLPTITWDYHRYGNIEMCRPRGSERQHTTYNDNLTSKFLLEESRKLHG